MAATNPHLLQYAGILGGGIVASYIFASVSPKTLPPAVETDNQQQHEFEQDRQPQQTQTQTQTQQHATNKQLLLSQLNNQSYLPFITNATDEAVNLALQIGKYGLPGTENLRFYDSYVSSVNYSTKQPNWVCEYLTINDLTDPSETDTSLTPVDRKLSKFTQDPSVPYLFRSQTCDYWRSGLSRGHLGAAGNHNDTQVKKNVTFLLSSNIIPQDLSMNGCDWYRLESFVKNIVKSKKFNHVWVVSGPVFKCKNEFETDKLEFKLIGGQKQNNQSQNLIPVPSHLFKVILCEKTTQNNPKNDENSLQNSGNNGKNDENGGKQSEYEYAAFMVANEPSNAVIPTPITDYQVSLREVERWTGLQFFPKLFGIENLDISNDLETLRDTEGLEGSLEGSLEDGLINESDLVRLYEKNGNIYDLCMRYGCIEGDNARSVGWRQLGLLQSTMSFDVLESAFKKVIKDNEKEGRDWLVDINSKRYNQRKQYLVDYYNKKIEDYRKYV